MSKSQVHHCRDTALCSTSVKTQKQKFGENKYWLEELGENVEKNRWRDFIIALQKFLFNR